MREFKDSEGRPWRLSLTCASAARVRDNVSVPDGSGGRKPFDLVDVNELGESLQLFRTNLLVLGEVLHALLMPQAHERNIDREAFLAGMSGDELDSGRVALEEEIVSFFPARLRGVVSSTLRKMAELEAVVMTQAEHRISNATLATPGPSSMSAPASSESTPESGPSGNSSMPAAVA